MKGKISEKAQRILNDEKGSKELWNIILGKEGEGKVTLSDGTEYYAVCGRKLKHKVK